MKKAVRLTIFSFLIILTMTPGTIAQKKVNIPAGKKGRAKNVIDTLASRRILNIQPFSLEILPPASGVQFYRYGIVFLSNSKTEGKMVRSHTSFGNIETYYAALEDSLLGKHDLFSRDNPFSVPCEGMTFNHDFSEMFYSMRQGKNDPEKIYMAEYRPMRNNTHEWISEREPLGFCTGKYTYTHPSVTLSGDTMVFASDRRESLGGFDIFVTIRNSDSWSEPVNLGSRINSARDELFPFLDSGRNLYYSSNGHRGLGGYDLFVCRYNGKGWDEPMNLTEEINSSNDEIALTIDRTDNKTAFFTRRTDIGRQYLKLYKVTLNSLYTAGSFTSVPGALDYIARTEVIPGEQGMQGTSVAGQTLQTSRQPEKVTNVPGAEAGKKPVMLTQQTKKEGVDTARITNLVREQPEKQQVTQPVTQKPAEVTPGVAAKVATESPVTQDKPVFRVQFSSSRTARGSFEITFGGVTYKTFEYLYNGMYRSCVGEFNQPAHASLLQKIVKKEGFPDAFVAAFIDNKRSLDPSLFK